MRHHGRDGQRRSRPGAWTSASVAFAASGLLDQPAETASAPARTPSRADDRAGQELRRGHVPSPPPRDAGPTVIPNLDARTHTATILSFASAKIGPPSPPPAQDSVEAGWLGIWPAASDVDYQLIFDLGGEAVKVWVDRRSPAWKAGVRDGDYVVSASPHPSQKLSFDKFEALRLPVGTEVFLKVRRPTTRADLSVAVKLGTGPNQKKLPKWQAEPALECGASVKREDRGKFEGAMSANKRISSLGFHILVRMLRKYDWNNGIYPSYRTLAKDLGRRRQTIIDEIKRLQHAGVLRVIKNGGPGRPDRRTNLFEVCWPQGWGKVVLLSGSRPDLGDA